MVWGVMGLFRIGELVVSGPKRHARVLRRMHCTLFSERDESFLCINLDGSNTDPFRGVLDVWLADLDVVILSPVFWFQRYESSLFSAGLNRGKAQAMFRWANGEMVTREKFVAGARQLLAQSGVDDCLGSTVFLCEEVEQSRSWQVRRTWQSCVLDVGRRTASSDILRRRGVRSCWSNAV
eukprot:g12685.t1